MISMCELCITLEYWNVIDAVGLVTIMM